LEATAFLLEKRVYELSEEFTIIILFGSKEKPFLLPFYTLDKFFVREYADNTRLGPTSSMIRG
jgi:hypothetical protein